MPSSNIKTIHDHGQSIWLDFIDRNFIATGELKKLIVHDGIRGVTSNPAIFEKAISAGSFYDADIAKYAYEGLQDEDIFFRLAISDIQAAADLFRPMYDSKEVQGADGYVSLEVSPRLAKDTQRTEAQAVELWKNLERENAMIKIPGTPECLPAIRNSIAKGININVTLLFGLEQYEAVIEAYISGLEDRLKGNLPLGSISSVASFFISRVDALVDPQLKAKAFDKYQGQVAIALAKQAYRLYNEKFQSKRFQVLRLQGARPQRLLWASTGTENPSYKDTMYVEALIGNDTVNTVPLDTLKAIQDHAEIKSTLALNADQADDLIIQIKAAGIDLDKAALELQEDGVAKFNQPFDKLLSAIRKQASLVHNSEHV